MPADLQATGHGDLKLIVPTTAAGLRLDAVVATHFSDYSRSRLQSWIKAGYLTVDGDTRRSKDRLVGGEEILLCLPADALGESWEESLANGSAKLLAQAMPIDIIHTDPHFYVLNKPADLVMHPAPGNRNGTLMNGLLHLEPALHHVPRAGIVHRLDKQTSGLCVVARTLKAHASLVAQLQARTVGREYLAVVLGAVPVSGTIDQPIGRHPRDRKRMAVVASGKPAITHYQLIKRFPGCALLKVNLQTGRTHQIRVHLAHLGHPLIGDSVYGKQVKLAQVPYSLHTSVAQFARQALHAQRLTLRHPVSAETHTYTVDPPADLTQLIQVLEA